jgi:glutathione peroxidase
MTSIYDFSMPLATGEEQAFAAYKDKVLLIVNTASKCGFTPQYEGLQALQDEFKDQGFSVLAFPCDQFGHQEPGTDSEIMTFCTTRFAVDFPVFSKVDVNGDNAAPIYQFMKQSAKGIFGSSVIKWNFTKFLVNKNGEVVKRYAPTTKPEQIKKDIAKCLAD